MRITSGRERFGQDKDRHRIEFRRLREQRWKKLTFWRYLILLILVILLFKFLLSLASGQ